VVVAAVHGLGGIGKSTLAARYAIAQARTGRCHPVWWITADTPAAVQTGLASLAAALEPQLKTALPLEALAERAIGWLTTHTGWLLVLDNVTGPQDVADLLARIPAGRILVTSRLAHGWHRLGAAVLRLDVLDEGDAIDLLTRTATGHTPPPASSGTGPPELEGAAELVRELGCLPLAIEQAGAYLHQNHLTPAAYLRLLAEHPAQLLDEPAHGSDAARTIARIWRLTLDRLHTTTPWAPGLLRILAWYAPQAIPRTLLNLTTGAQPNDSGDRPGLSAVELQRALGALAAYNMITLDADTVTVHRLVQALARTPDPTGTDPHRHPADIDTARAVATHLLNHATPTSRDDPAQWPTWRTLLPHIEALADHADPATDTHTTSLLLDRTAGFLLDHGALARAITYSERALTCDQRLHGPDHPNTLTSRNNLASAYQAAGDLGRAIPLLEQTLADRERVLGPDHPDTLASRNNLAGAYESAGDLGRAIPLFEQTLADRERVLGNNHPDTLASRNNLAYAYQAAGDLGRAIPLFEQTLADCERVLGADHPLSKTVRTSLQAIR